jgi:DNA modification methylase
VFGLQNFRNEIVWSYPGRERVSENKFQAKHDTIYFYTKSDDYYFNPCEIMRPLSENTIKKFKYEDEKGKYRLMGRGLEGSPIKSARDISPEWEKTHPELTFRHYLKDGALPLDWINIPPINQNAKERVGYPTQKPLALCEELIKTFSNENDIILDNCMGSGTTGLACVNTGRNFIGIELDKEYFEIAKNRIEGLQYG